MKYRFNAYGHPNIRASHKTTLEFTKEKDVSLKGDCIAGVNADFEADKIKDFIRKSKDEKKDKKVMIKIETPYKKIHEVLEAVLNQKFSGVNEVVIRKTDFISERTLAVSSDKAAIDLSRELIKFLNERDNKIKITLQNNIRK